MMQIVRRGRAVVRRLEPRAASPLGPLRRITTVIGLLLPMADVPTSRHSGRNGIRPLTTTIVVIRSRALTIRLLQAPIQRRELIPHRAAAIRLRLAPIPHPAAAIAVEVAAVGAAAVAIAVEAAVGAAAVAIAVQAAAVGGAAAAVAVEAAAAAAAAAAVARVVVVEAAEAHTAVEVPAHTVILKSLCRLKGPPESPGRAFCLCAEQVR